MPGTTVVLQPSASKLERRILASPWPGNLAGALVWLNILRLQFNHIGTPLTLASALTVLLTTLVIILFLVRRPAERTGSLAELLLAFGGSFVTLLLPGGGTSNWASDALQIGGCILGMTALLELGTSFGLAAADRGLKQSGIYAIIRHPLYASELVFFGGYFLRAPSLPAAVIIGLWWAIQVARMLREERIIAGYGAYAERVRWRVIPQIW